VSDGAGAELAIKRQILSRVEGVGAFVWCQPAEARVGSVEVLVGPPSRGACPDMGTEGNTVSLSSTPAAGR